MKTLEIITLATAVGCGGSNNSDEDTGIYSCDTGTEQYLLLGKSQSECIDELRLSIEIKPPIATHITHESTEAILNGVKDFYSREVGLNVLWEYETQRKSSFPEDIHLTFGEIDDCVAEWFSNAEAVLNYRIGNTTNSQNRQEAKQLLERLRFMSAGERQILDQEATQQARSILLETSGVTYVSTGQIYLFPENDLEMVVQSMRSPTESPWAAVLAHEIGHIFGIKDAPYETRQNGRYNIMHANESHLRQQDYGFSDQNKVNIQAQMCQPKEQQ